MVNSSVKQSRFELVDKFVGLRLGINLNDTHPGSVTVVETTKRLEPEKSYGYIRVFWLMKLADRQCIASVPPGTGPAIESILCDAGLDKGRCDSTMVECVRHYLNQNLDDIGSSNIDRVMSERAFACSSDTLIIHKNGDCRQLIDSSIPPAEGIYLPEHCFTDGIAYGVVEDNHVVSVAYAHRTGLMEDCIADIGVETAMPYRGRGYAKTAVSAVYNHITQSGGEGWYHCPPKNVASMATALSVGCLPYSSSLILTASAG